MKILSSFLYLLYIISDFILKINYQNYLTFFKICIASMLFLCYNGYSRKCQNLQ
nr:MAG TPA: hypothetical protein [Caudoviricetes sp.]